MRTVPSHRVVIGSQHRSESITGTGTVVVELTGTGTAVGVGLQMGIPIKHWNRLGSQHPVIVEGIGRGVGLGVNEELILNR